MKALILGTDFLKDANGVLRIIETNTNIDTHNDITPGLDWVAFKQLLVDNSITKLHFISTEGNFIKASAKLNKFDTLTPNVSLKDKMNEIMVELSGSFTHYGVPKHSVTVPFIEDADDVLIIRTSYDATAVVDETYAKDKVNFHRLISNETFSPGVYYNSSLDVSLNIDQLVELHTTDTNIPNYIVKTRYPNTSYSDYPRMYKITSLENLQLLKDSLLDEEYMEEYHTNSENFVNDKIGVIRSLDILYGGNLDCLHMGSYIMTSNVKNNQWETTYDSNGKMENNCRPMWITKFSSFDDLAKKYILDDDTSIICADGTLKFPNELLATDSLKNIGLSWVPENEIGADNIPLFLEGINSGSFATDLTEFTVGTSTIQDIQQFNVNILMIKVTLENGVTYEDVPNSSMLIERFDTLTTTFQYTNAFRLNDSVVFFDYVNNTLTKSKITNLEVVIVNRNIYSLDVETNDIFLPLADSTLGISFIQHNASDCQPWCQISDCTWMACDACAFCGGGLPKI